MIRGRRQRRRPGALLLETLLALAVFSASALAVLALANRAAGGLALAQDRVRACDLARSAIAQIEAGLGNAESLHGPVPSWRERVAAESGAAWFDESLPAESGWELEVQTEPSQFDGLTLVRVRAILRASGDGDRVRAEYSMAQLVRLLDAADEGVGEEDDVAEAARAGAREQDSESGGALRDRPPNAGRGGGEP